MTYVLIFLVVLVVPLIIWRAVQVNARMGWWWVVGLILVGGLIWSGGASGEMVLSRRGRSASAEDTALIGLAVLASGFIGLVVNLIGAHKRRRALKKLADMIHSSPPPGPKSG